MPRVREEVMFRQTEVAVNNFISRVYLWMSGALGLTGAVSIYIAINPFLVQLFLGNSLILIALVIGELALVFFLSRSIAKLTVQQAMMAFLGYAFLNGITLASIFLIYTAESIATTFFCSAGTFFLMSVYGYTTKRDLTSIGNLAFMALVGLIVASVVNLFVHSSGLGLIISYAGVLIFVALTAYDTQRVKQMSQTMENASAESSKGAIMGALILYLDFINLFIMLLRIFGNRRD